MDPYRMLGVGADADRLTIQLAYEARLAVASRHGAVKHAQDLVAAYTLLTDHRRRNLYDRLGITTGLDRPHPLQRWSPPRAVPFRQWAPAESVRSTLPCPGSRSGSRPKLVLAFAGVTIGVSLLLSAVSGTLPWQPGTTPDQARPPVRVVTEPIGPPRAPARGTVLCQTAGATTGYAYDTVVGTVLSCDNGTTPSWSTG